MHALSSGEAEYYSDVSLAAEALHMKSVLGFISEFDCDLTVRLRRQSVSE